MSKIGVLHKLPDVAVQRIGATLVVVDPVSAVKELLENAIDAKATSIAIEITANTIDSLQVKDNGIGINPADRAVACRKFYTSKIRTYEDIKSLASSTLGFRGEALASLAEISREFSITTRIDGEETATKLTYDGKGQLDRSERVSHAVGTTVKLGNLFHQLPVRKQTTLKDASKNLLAIKRMLQAYSLARPHLRLSLRVTKAKSETGNYIYALKKDGTTDEVVTKVLGRGCSAQCTQSFFGLENHFLEAFLPKLDADYSGIAGHGPFISVDRRPVAADRGIFKQCVSNFKEHLKKARFTSDTVKNPFMLLNISCPVGSYDPNIEPAKNDILFDDIGPVLAAWQMMLNNMYPIARPIELFRPITSTSTNLMATTDQVQASAKLHSATDPDETGEQLVNQNVQSSSSASNDDQDLLHIRTSPQAPGRQTSMSSYDEEDVELLAIIQRQESEKQSRLESMAASEDVEPLAADPWTIARLNARIRPPVLQSPFRSLLHPNRNSVGPGQKKLLQPDPPAPRPPLAESPLYRPELLNSYGQPSQAIFASPETPQGSRTPVQIDRTFMTHASRSPGREVLYTPPAFRVTPNGQTHLSHSIAGARALCAPIPHPIQARRRPRQALAEGTYERPDRNWFNFDQSSSPKRKRPTARIPEPEGADIRAIFEKASHRSFAPTRNMVPSGDSEDARPSSSNDHRSSLPEDVRRPPTGNEENSIPPESSMVFKHSEPSSDIFTDKFQAVLNSRPRSSPGPDLQIGRPIPRPSTASLPLEYTKEEYQTQGLSLNVSVSIAELQRADQLLRQQDNSVQQDSSGSSKEASDNDDDEYTAAFAYAFESDDTDRMLTRLDSCLSAKYPQMTDLDMQAILNEVVGLLLHPEGDTDQREESYGSDMDFEDSDLDL